MIFCVEDDSSICDLMLYALRTSGYKAEGFACAEDFWKEIQKQKPDLILLDLMLPDEDGVTILRKLKASGETENIPVIIASAKGTEFDKVIGLDNGADDYLVKPFGMMELISRVKAVLRRAKITAEKPVEKLTAGELELSVSAHRVTISGQEIVLTLKEFELLELFMEHMGTAFTRDDLFRRIWGSDFTGESRTVDVHIGTLRTKLGACGDLIRTVRGVGYRMEKQP